MTPLHKQDPADLRQIDIAKIYTDKRCLVIDDFPEIRGSLSRTLKRCGAAKVDTAADGEEAIRLCSSGEYDIVLCDYNLGHGKDGQQILEEVRYLRVLLMTSLFVMITGESSRHMVLGALECQPDDYITKPYTEASLKLRLDRAVVRHQALLHIKRAIVSGDYRRALEYCNEMILEGHRYAQDCLKMKGQLHYLLKQLKEAQQLYESVLAHSPTMWARLGMAKTQISLGHHDTAQRILEDIIAEDDRYVEAHDMLAEVHLARGDNMAAQESTQKATEISPKSVLRHRKLATLAEQNRDEETALKSHQQSIKWGQNSCYESAQDYFNYARSAARTVSGAHDENASVALAKQANIYLDRACKRFAGDETSTQSQLVSSQLLRAQGKEKEAQSALESAESMYRNIATPALETSLELARALQEHDRQDDARDLLQKLAAQHEDDDDVLSMIDSIADEPITEGGKAAATELTRNGINAYEQREFANAINVFNAALTAYPRHIGLHLNLVQTIIAATESDGHDPQHETMVTRSMRSIGHIDANHKQFKRYRILGKQLKDHYPKALTDAGIQI